MSFEVISLIILVASFCGLAFMVSRKIPALAEMPEPVFIKEETRQMIREKTKEVLKERSSSLEKSLQKILSKTRILSLKAEKKLSDWIIKLRERSLERTVKDIDNYWKEIRTSIKKKDKKS